MNNFEGINTGKWLVDETITGFDAKCPICGYCLPVNVNFDLRSLETQIQGLADFCPSCNEDMFKEDTFVVGQLEPSSKSLVINCEKISLGQRSLGIVIDISESIENIDTVEINGIKFTREV